MCEGGTGTYGTAVFIVLGGSWFSLVSSSLAS